MTATPIVDGHLDLAENVTIFGRDVTLPVARIREAEGRATRQATVSLPEIERGGIAVVVATVTPGFKTEDVPPGAVPQDALYRTPQEAEAQAVTQVALYHRWASEGRIRLVRSRSDLDDHLALWGEDRTPGVVLLMEGADAIVEVRDVRAWWDRGLRLIGLTYGDTRYARGVGAGNLSTRPGGLTKAGEQLLLEMAERGIGWDVTHLTEEGIWQGLELGVPWVCATHANARALTRTDRHLSDGVVNAIGARGGVVGLVLYNRFLDAAWRRGGPIAVTLKNQLRAHARHLANAGGWGVVGIGSDLDGGFGREECPEEIDSVADLHRVGSAVPAKVRNDVLGGNWLRFLRGMLPAT